MESKILNSYSLDQAKSQSTTPLKEKNIIITEIIETVFNNAMDYIFADPLQQTLKRNYLTLPNNEKYNIKQNKKLKTRVMCYNIMANSLMSIYETHLDFEKKYMSWEYRSLLLIKEIKAYNPDIIGLQELDYSDTAIRDEFADNYDFIYKRRGNSKGDGCAILYNRNLYNLVLKKSIEFFIDPQHPLLCRENICLIAVLEPKDDNFKNELILFGVTHIYFNEKRGDIKAAQMHLAIKALKRIANLFPNKNKMIYYCGDFNSIPNSALYNFLNTGSFNFSEMKTRQLSGQMLAKTYRLMQNSINLAELVTRNIYRYRFNFKNIEQDIKKLSEWITNLRSIEIDNKSLGDPNVENIMLNCTPSEENHQIVYHLKNDYYMKSAYANYQKYYFESANRLVNPEVRHPFYSTYESLISSFAFKATLNVDYIWFNLERATTKDSYSNENKKYFNVNGVYELPRLLELSKYQIFPNKNYPSDHFSLIADFIYE